MSLYERWEAISDTISGGKLFSMMVRFQYMPISDPNDSYSCGTCVTTVKTALGLRSRRHLF